MRIAVCDDEQKITDMMTRYIKDIFENMDKYVSVDTFSSAFEMSDYMEKHKSKYDLIFMDIMLKDDTGIHLGDEILKRQTDIKIVFMTGYMEYVEDIFDIVPFDLVLKPIKYEKVRKVIDKLTGCVDNDKSTNIIVRNKEGVFSVNLNDITYVESEGRHLIINRNQAEKIKVIMTMSEMEEMLNEDFIKCHRSYFINCRNIKRLDKKMAYMVNNSSVPISASNYKKVFVRYIQILEE